MKMKKKLASGAVLAFAVATTVCAKGEVLVDFAKDGGGYYLMCANFTDPEREPRQMELDERGLTVRFDSAREKRAPWATMGIPAAVGNRVDWNGKFVELVASGVPEGRIKRSCTLDFTDQDGEIFQIHPTSSVVDDDGNLRIAFRIDISLRPHWSRSWGGKVNNEKVDGALRFSSLDFSFLSLEGTGSITLARIEEVEESSVVRTVCSREPIPTDTAYPGAKPFPGAEFLAFQIEPAFSGKAALTLSTESAGEAWRGRKSTYHADVTNGLVRFDTKLPYDSRYEFMRIDCSPDAGSAVKGPFRTVRAEGRFCQTAAEAMRLDVDTKNELHICRDERERPELVVSNPTKVALKWKTVFAGHDYFGRKFSVPFDRKVGAGESVRVPLPWPLPAKGFWHVKAKVTAGDGSVAKKEVAFAYIDRHDQSAPWPREQFKFGMHYHGTLYMPDHVDRTIAAMVACGVKLVRTDYSFMFGDVQRKEGVYDWEKADFLLKKLRDVGMSLDIIIGGTPQWAWDETANWAKSRPSRRTGVRPSRPGLFRDFCEKIARRYGTEIDYYETGNEWDFSPQAVITPDEAIRMQREAYEGVHAGCPDAWVSTPGWAHVATADLEGGTNDVCKGLVEKFARHPEYYDIWALHGHGAVSAYCRQIDDIFLPLKNANPMKRRPWFSNESSQTGAFGEEREVTRTVWEKPLFAWSRGSHDFIWYNLRATGWFDGHEPGFGVITPDYYPRASYAAFAAMTKIFGGLEYDGALYSRRRRHLLRFRGVRTDFAGMVLAVWDEAATAGKVRRVRVKTDAKGAWRSDLMGNRTRLVVKNGVLVVEPLADPQAYILEGATSAEAVDAAELPAEVAPVKTIRSGASGRAADFTLDLLKHVKDYYAANPETTARLWKGPDDHAARIWLDRVPAGVKVRVEVTDDISSPGDRVEALVSEGTTTVAYPVKRIRREGVKDLYETTLPVAAQEFGFDVRIYEDDGAGEDGYLRLVGDSEDAFRVKVLAAEAVSAGAVPVRNPDRDASESDRQTLVPMPRRCVWADGHSSVTNVRCVVDANLPPEGYRLVISPSEVTVASRDEAGAFYARQTIRQLGNPLPCGTIEDCPSFRWRGLMLDEGRHFFGKEVVKRCLDRMAEYKLNVFHWHLTEDQGWRIALDRFPELTRYGAVRPDAVAHGSRGLPSRGDCVLTGMRYGPYFYTSSDISEILSYAKERHIVVVPEVELPGHLQALLAAHPEFSCRGDLPRTPRVNYDISDEVLCVGNDRAVAFMEQVYDEIVKMFPNAHVHIGGDECPRVRWKDCVKCQRRIRDLGLKDEEALQGWVTRHFTDYLAKKGRRAIGWDEVLAGEPSAETVIQCWRDAKFASAAAMKGHDVIVSPVLETYFSVSQGLSDRDPYTYLSPELTLPLEKVYRFDPLRGIDDSVKARVLGAECCLWSECIWNLYDLEWKLLPRLCAFAEALWSAPPAPRDTDDFLRRMNIHRRRLIGRGINCAPLK